MAKDEADIKGYTLLRDRRPKAHVVKRRLPSGKVLKFKSAFDYKDGDLWDAVGTLQAIGDNVRLVPSALRKMSVDADENSEIISEEEGWLDADTLDLLQDVGEEVFKALGTVGESQG